MLAVFVEPATARPTGSMQGRPPGAVAWIGSTRLTAKQSKTSTSTRWSPTPSSSYAAGLHGKPLPILLPTTGEREGEIGTTLGGNATGGERPWRESAGLIRTSRDC